MLLGSVVLFKRVLGLLNPTGDWAGFAMQLGQFSRAKIGVDPRGGEIGMTHELLDCEIAKAGFEPLPRGQVPEGMQRPGTSGTPARAAKWRRQDLSARVVQRF